MNPKDMLRVDLEGRIAHSRLGHPDSTSATRYPVVITELANDLREVITEAHFERSRGSLMLLPRLPDTLSMVREDPSHVRAYARQCGISTEALAAERFSGIWCLTTTRSGEPNHQVLSTRSAVDPGSALRANLSELISAAAADPKGREPRTEHDLTCRLHHAVDDWEATLKGHRTSRTFGEPQIQQLVRDDPSLQHLAAAALGGDADAQRKYLSVARFDELERDRHGESNSATWSMWTSKGHPADERLVVTRGATDALSYHQLNPHARTRYVSFDGTKTAARDARLDRALAIMPPRSLIVVATDRSQEGQSLADTVHTLATRHPSLRIEHHTPHRTTWNLDLRLARGRHSDLEHAHSYTREVQAQPGLARALSAGRSKTRVGLER